MTHRYCTVPGCGRAQHADGYCKPHRRRWRRHGDPRADVPISYRTSLRVAYSTVHDRLRARHGPANEHGCDRCGAPAAYWSYDHGDPDELTDPATGRVYSTDPARYRPLCRSCHRRAVWSQRFRHRPPLDPPTCAQLYRDGCSVRGIARQLGYSPTAIRDALRAADVTLRPPGRHRRRGPPQPSNTTSITPAEKDHRA